MKMASIFSRPLTKQALKPNVPLNFRPAQPRLRFSTHLPPVFFLRPAPPWPVGQRFVLLYLLRKEGREVLLIRKLRGEGMGKINGPGGKIELGETPEQAAQRETAEEVGAQCHVMEQRFVLRCQGPHADFSTCHVFVSDQFKGEPHATPEAIPLWAEVGSLPLEEMWEDDRAWLPGVLEGKRGEGWFTWDKGGLAEQLVEWA